MIRSPNGAKQRVNEVNRRPPGEDLLLPQQRPASSLAARKSLSVSNSRPPKVIYPRVRLAYLTE